jgi:tousled-like kinase
MTQKAALKARLEELEEIKKTVTKRNKKLRDSLLGSSSATGSNKSKAKGKLNNANEGDDDDDDDDDDTSMDQSNPSTSHLPGPFGLSSDLFGVGSGLTMGTLMGIATTTNGPGNNGQSRTQILAELELTESEEAVKVAITSVKRDLELLDARLHALEGERNLLMLEMKRQKSERESRYKGHVVLGDDKRYLLLSLLGKGGFSEVWRAMDLWETNEVAIKIHQLNSHWGEEKKQSYVRHAMREYEIQSALSHPHIVRLLQVIVMDADSFATVLEYCRGTDLEKLLKQHGQLPEREARAIVIQVLSALRYLNGYSSPWDVENNTGNNTTTNSSSGTNSGVPNSSSSSSSSSSSANNSSSSSTNNNGSGNVMLPPPAKRKIIHYDLKPPNILFDEYRRVKVTDFGLSKIVDETEEGASSMELTSQGAGTYWYLPPECFKSGRTRISSKVDVWSIGVIFYQMLFGRKPFGEGQSQEQIMQQGTLTAEQIREVQFPTQPKVSDGAKNFIRRCLTVRQEARPDVLTICEDSYLRQRLAGTR